MNFFNGVTAQGIMEAQDGFEEFDIGENKAYIKFVSEKTSNNGNLMIEITFAKHDCKAEVKYWIVDNEWKLSKLKELCYSFGISPNNVANLREWLYKEGCVVCKKGEPNNNGKVYNKVSFLKPLNSSPSQPNVNQQQAQRPPMQAGYMTSQVQQVNQPTFADDIPF